MSGGWRRRFSGELPQQTLENDGRDRKEGLALFLNLVRHEQESSSILPDSHRNNILNRLPSEKQWSTHDFFCTDKKKKSDYDWLRTPPHTPLLQHEKRVGNKELPALQPVKPFGFPSNIERKKVGSSASTDSSSSSSKSLIQRSWPLRESVKPAATKPHVLRGSLSFNDRAMTKNPCDHKMLRKLSFTGGGVMVPSRSTPQVPNFEQIPAKLSHSALPKRPMSAPKGRVVAKPESRGRGNLSPVFGVEGEKKMEVSVRFQSSGNCGCSVFESGRVGVGPSRRVVEKGSVEVAPIITTTHETGRVRLTPTKNLQPKGSFSGSGSSSVVAKTKAKRAVPARVEAAPS